MAIRRRRSRRSVPSGRKFVWARFNTANTITGDPIPTAFNMLSEFEAELGGQLIGATITRIRGVMGAWATNQSLDGVDQLRVAARVTSGQFDVSTPAAENNPWDDSYADWMLWEPFVNANIERSFSQTADRLIDVRSQRKLEEIGEQLTLFVAGNPGAPTISWGFSADLSIGVKLS